jgi:hypothetical protein
MIWQTEEDNSELKEEAEDWEDEIYSLSIEHKEESSRTCL